MTTTRPIVNYSVPDTNPKDFGVQVTTTENYGYSSLNCEGCDTDTEPWETLAFVTVGMTFFALMVLLFARKYIFKIHEIPRN